MQLKISDLTLDQQVWEFDLWVTPALTDIRNTDRFRSELDRVLAVLNALTAGGAEDLPEARYVASLVDRVFLHLDRLIPDPNQDIVTKAEDFLNSLAALLFLVTGKSDNNIKCQFPIYLRNTVRLERLPNVRMRKGGAVLGDDEIPRVLDSESYMTRVARLYACQRLGHDQMRQENIAAHLLHEFAKLLLADTHSRLQLSAFLNHYRRSNEIGEDPSVLLTPLVIFQVRGSVAASGGHEPEEILRRHMQAWGMIRDLDFNIHDVVLDIEAGRLIELNADVEDVPQGKKKTRAYDFVLPFRTRGWTPQIFIQSQFYAGDSGSVSHKNVDQSSASRLNATRLVERAWPDGPLPRFLEYVDGAGYSASLNGDLKSLLSFSDTAGFFQIRSAPIRLRRELQQIGFLTPLEVAHAALLSGNSLSETKERLLLEGYSADEIQRGLNAAMGAGYLGISGDQVFIDEQHIPTAKKLLLLDVIACAGHNFTDLSALNGVVLVPGYGPYYGLTLVELQDELRGIESIIWPGTGWMFDLQQLCAHGWIILR